ncbi:hypothetical protein BBD42_13725 [Paenibacillus sp. BIHB 4019]|uniref:Chemotaxis protein n=1 Tax=Paenibacillus sp. BIHB 4019 TaxID=1870819 RepID=A0A1B2DIA0_9BACL|nr:methyl-accepting chemotaxis protein [Paenibacillus sp. BIHB 4019]ANY67416.1 hypothetical protein BBD42_13725 [Paenibacillus sp. BIHB 4019]
MKKKSQWKQKFYMRRLRGRLLLYISLMLIFSLLVSTFFSYTNAKIQLQDKMGQTAASTVSSLNMAIEQIVGLEKANVKQLAYLLSSEAVDEKAETTQALIDNFTANHPEVEIVTLGNANGSWMKSPNPGQEDYDPRERSWYKAIMAAPGEAIVSPPGLSATTNKYTITVSQTFADGQGGVTVALSVEAIGQLIQNVKIGSEGFVYLMDQQGVILAHPTIEVGTPVDNEGIRSILQQDSGELFYNDPINNVERKAFFVTNKDTGLKLVGALPTEEFTEAALPILLNSFLVMVISLVAAFVILFFIIRAITRPIEQLNRAARRVSEGYLQEKVETKRRDEIGELAGNFNAMVDSLRGIVMEVADSSNQLAAASQELSASTTENTKTVELVSELIGGAAQGADNQARMTDETRRTMEEMAIGITRIAEASSEIVQSSKETEQNVAEGSDKVQEVTVQMRKIGESIDQSSAQIEQLHDLSAQVTQMSTAIAGIAKQTNLLSLNAAIEASRAGDHGKGFAVVAQEVQKLADQTKTTADQILETIGQMTKLVAATYDMMKYKVSEDMRGGLRITEEAGQALASIEQSTRLIVQQIHDVSAVTEEMSASAEEVAASIHEVSGIANESSQSFRQVTQAGNQQLDAMEGISSSAVGLSEIASELQNKVGSFKL